MVTSRIRRAFDKLRRGDEGMTLVELLTVSALFLIVVSAAWMVLSAIQKSADAVASRQIASDEARTVTERTSRELRQGVEILENDGIFAVANPRDCEFFADVDQDGVAELVKYIVDGTTMTRQVIHSTSPAPALVTDFTIADPVQEMASSIDASWTGAMFTYYSSESPPQVENNTTSDQISAVEIRIVTEGKSGQESVTVDQKTWVKIRSVWSNLN